MDDHDLDAADGHDGDIVCLAGHGWALRYGNAAGLSDSVRM
jgi:hypothetical protein